jgi:hypothetical protein
MLVASRYLLDFFAAAFLAVDFFAAFLAGLSRCHSDPNRDAVSSEVVTVDPVRTFRSRTTLTRHP